MNRKEDLKLVFDFIADYLREEIKPLKNESPKISPETAPEKDKSAEHILDIMKAVEERDKKGANLNGLASILKKVDKVQEIRDREILKAYSENQKETPKKLKKVLKDAKEKIDNMERANPNFLNSPVTTIPLSETGEINI